MAFCTVDRLMSDLGMNGVRRGKRVRTTIRGKDGRRAGDQLDRCFQAEAPNRVWVADFTYVRTWAGFVYVAFVVDVFAQRIVAWHVATRLLVRPVDPRAAATDAPDRDVGDEARRRIRHRREDRARPDVGLCQPMQHLRSTALGDPRHPMDH